MQGVNIEKVVWLLLTMFNSSEGGYHIYAKVGKLDVVDESGNQKWNTRQEAEDAARWYIAKNW